VSRTKYKEGKKVSRLSASSFLPSSFLPSFLLPLLPLLPLLVLLPASFLPSVPLDVEGVDVVWLPSSTKRRERLELRQTSCRIAPSLMRREKLQLQQTWGSMSRPSFCLFSFGASPGVPLALDSSFSSLFRFSLLCLNTFFLPPSTFSVTSFSGFVIVTFLFSVCGELPCWSLLFSLFMDLFLDSSGLEELPSIGNDV